MNFNYLKYITVEKIDNEEITIVDRKALLNINRQKDLQEYLSGKHIKLNSWSYGMYKLYYIKNSIIEIDTYEINPTNEEFFKFDEDKNILTELPDKFDFVDESSKTHIIIHSYYINWYSMGTMIGECAFRLTNACHKRIDKIKFRCSGRYANASKDFKRAVEIELM